MIHVGLADDDALVRQTLNDLLNDTEDIRALWVARDGEEVLDILHSGDYPLVDVLLLDVQMPRMDGIAVTELLHNEMPNLNILILTTFMADPVMERAMAAGAKGFVAKEDPVTALAATIRHVVEGNMVLSPASLNVIKNRPDASNPVIPGPAVSGPTASPEIPALMMPTLRKSPKASAPARVLAAAGSAPASTASAASPLVAGPAPTTIRSTPTGVALSPRETEVLALMVEAYSNKQIARRLGLSEATIKTHVSTVIAKMGVQDRVGAVVQALRNGLV